MAKSFDQAAVLPIREGLVGLITSSNGKRWVLPKGNIDFGHTAREAARIEAWEEAGWIGIIESEPFGSYTYTKEGRERLVLVYLMRVSDEREEWPEMMLRTRTWVSPEEAALRVEEPELRTILRKISPLLKASESP
jgi:8-oxo-dGTP pyrophosphatase MutT (NUDIX family)